MVRRLPSLRALVAFEAAARRRNFSRAADDLARTQGAVSRQIRTLEEFLGVTLFERQGTRPELTGAGHRLLHEVAPLLDGLQTAVDGLRRSGASPPPVVVATYPAFAARWLLPRMLDFRRLPGGGPVRIETIPSNAAFDPERHEIGILQGVAPFPGLRSEPLLPERLVLAGAPALAGRRGAGLPEIDAATYLRHATRPTALRIWSAGTGAALADPAGGTVFDSYEMMIAAAMHGHGIGVFPELLIGRELASGELALAHSHVAAPRAGYHLVSGEDRAPAPAAAALQDWLRAGAAGEDAVRASAPPPPAPTRPPAA